MSAQPAIDIKGQVLRCRIPWGIFGSNGKWWPNPLLRMSEDEQRKQNQENGFLPKE